MKVGDKVTIKGKQYELQTVYNHVYDETTYYLVPIEDKHNHILIKVYYSIEELEEYVKEREEGC